MARILVSALNITTHPHSPQRYRDLLTAAARVGRVVSYYGSRVAQLGPLQSLRDNSLLLRGVLYTFDRIDAHGQWFDSEKNDAADPIAVKAINIPSNLHPNFRRMDFLFDVQKHCLYFEARNVNAESFPPRNVKRVFEHLLNMPELIERFGMVDVTIIPSSEALETIFSMEGLAKLRIHVVRPNPDDNYLTHTAVLERLRRQHAQSMDIEYSKERSADKLEPDQETRALAEIAATNGFVNGDGKGPNNEPRHESTKGHPMVEPIVIKDSMDPFEQLIAFAMSRRL